MSAAAIAGPVAGAIAGAALSGGGSKPDPNYSYGYSGGSSFSQGGSSQSSSSYSEQYPTNVWGVQSPYLQDLYSRAQSLYGTGGNQQQVQGMWNQNAAAMHSLLNPGANPLMDVYQRQMQQGLEQNILPTIRREATGGNMLGGTRQGVAEGLALQEAVNAQSEFAARLYNADRDRMVAAMGIAPQMMQAGLGIPWYGMQQYSGIVGSPTVVGGGGYSQSSGSGGSYNVGGSEQFGENWSGPDANNPYGPQAGTSGGTTAPSGVSAINPDYNTPDTGYNR